jgi:hypothetical protein
MLMPAASLDAGSISLDAMPDNEKQGLQHVDTSQLPTSTCRFWLSQIISAHSLFFLPLRWIITSLLKRLQMQHPGEMIILQICTWYFCARV